MSKISQDKYRQAGLCILCGGTPRENRATCQKCSDRCYRNHKASQIRRIAAGKCFVCGSKYLVTKRHCKECAEKHYARARKGYAKFRNEVFLAYGGYRCACCGEEEKAFLTIDHINGGGSKHRKEIGQSNFYRWLRDNGYPPGFQVLCMNCQWGKKNCGICPHKLCSDENASVRREVRKPGHLYVKVMEAGSKE
jgi:hypothetical protein